MAYRIVDERLGAQPISDTSTTARHALGTMVRAVDDSFGEGVFLYLKGADGTAVGSLLTYDQTFSTTTLTVNDSRGIAAVAMASTSASEYGWYQVRGAAVVRSSDAAAGNPAYFVGDGDPGAVSALPTANTLVDGMVFTSATGIPTNGFAIAEVAFPVLSGNSGLV